MADGACLAGGAAALDGDLVVVLTLCTGQDDGLVDDDLEGLKSEIIIDISLVDSYITFTGYDIYSGD